MPDMDTFKTRIAEVRGFLKRPPRRGNHDSSPQDRVDTRIAAELASELYDEVERLQALIKKQEKRRG